MRTYSPDIHRARVLKVVSYFKVGLIKIGELVVCPAPHAMDFVLNTADDVLLDKVWAYIVPLTNVTWEPAANATTVSAWPRDYVPRQLISLSVLTIIGIHLLYFSFAYASYQWIFNHDMMRHPRFLKNQVRLEIQSSLRAFPVMMLLTIPWFQAEVMGYSKLYDGVDTYGYAYLVLSVPM